MDGELTSPGGNKLQGFMDKITQYMLDIGT